MNKPRIMGILNTTPDSFYEKSRALSLNAAIEKGIQLCKAGADILDIGGESTRPGAEDISESEELARTIPVIEALSKKIAIPISIDTMKPRVAAAALKAGATWINDVTGFQDPEMRRLGMESEATLCVMHMQGIPRSMQNQPDYPEGIIPHLLVWFQKRIDLLLQSGIAEKQIILDPGIGFGKTVAHNVEIIHNLPRFKALGFPLLLGLSRKSFLSKILSKPPSELLPATLAMNALALRMGVDIIRVHDVAEHKDIVDLIHHVDANQRQHMP